MTIKVKAMTARCPANQEALDKLMEIRLKAEKNPNSNFVFTVKRAMNSLKDCQHHITTQRQAQELKYVGTRLAKIICPVDADDQPNCAVSSSRSSTATAARTTATTATKWTQRQISSTATTSSKKVEHGPSGKQKAYESAKAHAESLVLPRGPWKVVLLIDGREHKSKHMVSKCKQVGIPSEERHLPIGDMAWIAKCGELEVMLGTILERKEVSDLACSLFGTRYLEQRLRLQHSGLPQIILLVEGSLHSVTNCPAETLRMAMMETRVQLGFQCVQTPNLQETVKTLKSLHRRVVQRSFPKSFEELPSFGSPSDLSRKRRRRPSSLLELTFDSPPIPPFGKPRFITYHELKTKVERDREAGTKTVGAIYMAMLKQVATLSDKKCQAIAKNYPTMSALLNAFEETDKPVQLVRDVPCDRQKVGPRSSAELCVVCCTDRDGSVVQASNLTSKPKATRLKMPPSATSSFTTNPPPSSVGLKRMMSVDSSKNPYTPSNALPPTPERKTPARRPLQARNMNAPNDCVDLSGDTPVKPANLKLSDGAESSPLLTVDNCVGSASPGDASFASSLADDSITFVTTRPSGPAKRQHLNTLKTPPPVAKAPVLWSPSSSSSSSFIGDPTSNGDLPAAISPARMVSLESSQGSLGRTGRVAAQKPIAKPPARASIESSVCPSFLSPSSVPCSSQSTFGSASERKSQPQQIEIIDISDDDDEEEEEHDDSEYLNEGLRARMAKRLKQDTIEIFDG